MSVLRRFGLLAWGWGLFCLVGVGEVGRAAGERGFVPLRTYVPEVPRASSQYFELTTGRDGLVYATNGGGLLIFDGARWQGVGIGRAQAAIAVGVSEDGRIGVGGVGDFGLVEPGGNGELTFVSLVAKLPAEQRDVGQVYSVASAPNGFYFMGDSALLLWDGAEVRTLLVTGDADPHANLYQARAERWVANREGLFRVRGERLEAVPGGEFFRARRVDRVMAAEDGLLISVRREGLYRWRPDGSVVPFAPEASRWAVESRVYASAELPGGGWVLGSILGGALFLAPDGRVTQRVDSRVGLPDDFVSGLAVDHEQGLWIALNSGLVRLDVASPYTVLDRRSGLMGSVYAVTRHRGSLWVGAAAGLFTSAPAEAGAVRAPGAPVEMRPIAGPPPSVWSLLAVGEDLLVGSAVGVWSVSDGRTARLIAGTEPIVGYHLAPSSSDPNRVWVGTQRGLAWVERGAEGWRLGRLLSEVEVAVRSIVEGENVLWCGTEVMDVLGVELPLSKDPADPPRLRRASREGTANVAWIGGHFLVIDHESVAAFDPATGERAAQPLFSGLEGDGAAMQASEDSAGNLWLSTRPVIILPKTNAGWDFERRAELDLPIQGVQAWFPEADGTMWLAAENGLYAHRGSREGPRPLPVPLLSRVLGERDEVLLAGLQRRPLPSLELPASLRRLRVEIGPLSFRGGLRFETRLDPLDRDWSSPSPEPFADLARLPGGRYTFRVRTVDDSNGRGGEASWSFRVLPAWYERSWAYGLWALLGLSVVRGYARLRSRALRQRAAELETRVAEQTVELRATVTQLQQAQGELEHANARLEEISLQDDLTGVANRRRLGPVLASEWSRATRANRPLAFILLDLDHFKLLNDTRGHLEGDRCLQRVARYLDGAIRRSGDLLVRFGGEEFGVLLPETNLSGALHLAEELRLGIEELAIPYGDGTSARVTASFGVACLQARAEDPPESLIEAADAALYRAKNQGRNQVRAA